MSASLLRTIVAAARRSAAEREIRVPLATLEATIAARPDGQFRAGMTETDNCIDVLREKLNQYSPDSRHFYYISDLIAQGKCSERN